MNTITENVTIQADDPDEAALDIHPASDHAADVLRVRSGVDVQSQQAPTDPTAEIPAGTPVVRVNERGDLLVGTNEIYNPDVGGKSILDGLYRADTRQWVMRTLHLGELGDTPELGLQRAAGDYPVGGANHDDVFGVGNGTTVGNIWFRGYSTPDGGTPGVTKGGSFGSRSASIYCRVAEDVYPTKFGGRLFLSVSSKSSVTGGTSVGWEVLELSETGAVGIIDGSNVQVGAWESARGRGDLVVGRDAVVHRNLHVKGGYSFHGANVYTKPTITGSRGGNAALTILLIALANRGLLTDNTTA